MCNSTDTSLSLYTTSSISSSLSLSLSISSSPLYHSSSYKLFHLFLLKASCLTLEIRCLKFIPLFLFPSDPLSFPLKTWDGTDIPCLYAGSRQGGPVYEVEDPNDPLIEGRYYNYIVDGPFATQYQYSHFEENMCR